MKPSMMSPLTRKVLAGLPGPAQREFRSWFANKLQILTGSNELEAGDDRLPHTVRGFARQRNRAAELALGELDEIFGTVHDHNAHLGSTKE